MQVSREIDYGVRAVVVMAANLDSVMSKKRIAEEFDIPVNFLAIILPKLVHYGIVESLPGPRGGYRLARPAREVSVFDVISAMDSCFCLNRCNDGSRGCEQQKRCPVSAHWKKLQENVESYLRGITFDNLATEFGACP